jgi:excisionase family DNA binding protein
MRKLLTVLEMAEFLQLSRWAVYDMARDGRLPAVRLSRRRLRFDPAAVADAIRHASGAEQAHDPHGATTEADPTDAKSQTNQGE